MLSKINPTKNALWGSGFSAPFYVLFSWFAFRPTARFYNTTLKSMAKHRIFVTGGFPAGTWIKERAVMRTVIPYIKR